MAQILPHLHLTNACTTMGLTGTHWNFSHSDRRDMAITFGPLHLVQLLFPTAVYAADLSLQKMVLVLMEHFCHSDNRPVVQHLCSTNNDLLALGASGTPHVQDPATAAAAACATSALRLLKLTAAGLFDMDGIAWGDMMKKGAFGSIQAAVVRLPPQDFVHIAF